MKMYKKVRALLISIVVGLIVFCVVVLFFDNNKQSVDVPYNDAIQKLEDVYNEATEQQDILEEQQRILDILRSDGVVFRKRHIPSFTTNKSVLNVSYDENSEIQIDRSINNTTTNDKYQIFVDHNSTTYTEYKYALAYLERSIYHRIYEVSEEFFNIIEHGDTWTLDTK